MQWMLRLEGSIQIMKKELSREGANLTGGRARLWNTKKKCPSDRGKEIIKFRGGKGKLWELKGSISKEHIVSLAIGKKNQLLIRSRQGEKKGRK